MTPQDAWGVWANSAACPDSAEGCLGRAASATTGFSENGSYSGSRSGAVSAHAGRLFAGGPPKALQHRESAVQSEPDGTSHQRESHHGVERPQPPATCQPLPDPCAEDDPSMRGCEARDEEHGGH